MSGLAQGRQIWSGAESATKRAESGTKSRQLKIVITKVCVCIHIIYIYNIYIYTYVNIIYAYISVM